MSDQLIEVFEPLQRILELEIRPHGQHDVICFVTVCLFASFLHE